MNAMIFAAGLGTRLKPLTDTMPKAMVPVGGKPLIHILIDRLKAAGVGEVVINVHHFAQQIVDYVKAHDSFGLDIRFSDETDMLLETGGGLKKAVSLFSDSSPILVHNVDILSNADLTALYSQSRSTTLLTSQRATQRYLLFDRDDRLVGWVNIATGAVKSPYEDLRAIGESSLSIQEKVDKLTSFYRPLAFSGIQVFYPDLAPLMDTWQGKFSIIDFYLSICDKTPIRCTIQPGLRLLDVGKLNSLEEAESFV
ncbi:MAG: sugar phosphate nucleotidyltransferase [Bacteroidales bacterium]|nr:sugar phosphate nucleotidyltransferase [Bacteroidales bacterium]